MNIEQERADFEAWVKRLPFKSDLSRLAGQYRGEVAFSWMTWQARAYRKRRGELVAWPKVNGVGRDAGNAQSLVIYFAAEPTDDQMRAVHDVLAPAQPAEPVKPPQRGT